jgi:hypothetical protein
LNDALRNRCDQLLDLLGHLDRVRDVGVIVVPGREIYQLVRAIVRDYLNIRRGWRQLEKKSGGSDATINVEAAGGFGFSHSAKATVGEPQRFGWRPDENM